MLGLTISSMKDYLSKSISSYNRNKLNGLLAEIDFRDYLGSIGFGDKVSMGGWIARRVRDGKFSKNTVAFFPEIIVPGQGYKENGVFPKPPMGLHTICSTLHQIGIHSYYCFPTILEQDDPISVNWFGIQLGIPTPGEYERFPDVISKDFSPRTRKYNFLRYKTDVSSIPDDSVSDEFSKENIRVAFQNEVFSEISDIDGIIWGEQYTYPVEIKEKTPANDRNLGDYFGLDVGPFVKLAFYAAKRGNLHSLFIVREIDNTEDRELVNWWFITYDQLAQYASWVIQGGGIAMTGGGSTVVKIPKAEFTELNRQTLNEL